MPWEGCPETKDKTFLEGAGPGSLQQRPSAEHDVNPLKAQEQNPAASR